ncbi:MULTISPECIES: hypothetical protein [unclassified Streptomyces]|nr:MULTISPECIES: hypothetical protein [unclassified Streptomyces]
MNDKWTAIITLVTMVSLSFAFSAEFGWAIICAVVTEVCVKHLKSNNIDQ